jgi:hypothetical protein
MQMTDEELWEITKWPGSTKPTHEQIDEMRGPRA